MPRLNAEMKEATTEAVTLSPTEGTSMIVGMYKAGTYKRTPILTGSPGCGKTSAARDAAKELGWDPNGPKVQEKFNYIEINPTMPADEVGGIPDLVRVEGQATRTDYALPAWFPLDPEWKGIICLDDALQGDRMMQQTLANLILTRNLRGHKLPDGAMIVATGNRMEDKAGVTRTLSHFADRMCWLNIATDTDSWLNNFAVPKGIDEKIVGYILMDKSKLDQFDPDKPKCATPRTWEAVNGHLRYLDTLSDPKLKDVKNKFAQAVLSGELGLGEASKFWAFCQLFGKLPDIDDLLNNPATAKIDYPIDIQYALVVAIANRIDNANFGAALEYIDRIGPDLTTLAVRLAIKHNPKIVDPSNKTWQEWAIKNQELIHGF